MTEIAEDDEGLVQIATRQVPCEGQWGWGDCEPGSHRLPALVKCMECDQMVPPVKALRFTEYDRVRADATMEPHLRAEVRQLRWVHEVENPDYEQDRFWTEPIPEGPEWTFTNPKGT